MNGNQVFVCEDVFLYSQQTGATEIDHTVIILSVYHLSYTIVLRRRAVIDQIALVYGIHSSPVVGINYREQVESVREPSFSGVHLALIVKQDLPAFR
jgi:hypothetical protein